MFKKSALAASLALAAALAPLSARASLIGDTVTGSLSANPSWGYVTPFAQASAVVGAGVEFQGQWVFSTNGDVYQVWDIAVDVGPGEITVSAHENTSGANNVYGGSELFTLLLGSLDLGQDITGVSLRSGPGPVAMAHDAHGVSLTWTDLPFGSANSPPNGGSWVFDLLPAVATTPDPGPGQGTVPEPGSLALALPALALLVAGRRRGSGRRPG